MARPADKNAKWSAEVTRTSSALALEPETMADVDKTLLLDKPSKLTEKRIY